jgi:flagellar biosynthetic protein FliO
VAALIYSGPVWAQSGVERTATLGWLRALLALVFVLALFFFLVYIIRRFYPRILQQFPNAAGKNELIELRSARALGPKRFLYIVRVGEKTYLLGATDHTLTKIDQWSETEDQTPDKGFTSGSS